MPRPLFDIAREISADWPKPSPQAKTYLKGMHYLLGMDDYVADLDAPTSVRMFLLYSKEWCGPVADRIKAELQAMRSTHLPTNVNLVEENAFTARNLAITCCELCEAPLGEPAKFVEAYTYWNERARMCMHCGLFVTPGIDVGDGALHIKKADGTWVHLHGEAIAASTCITLPLPDRSRVAKTVAKPNFGQQIKFFSRRVIKKCVSMAKGYLRRSA